MMSIELQSGGLPFAIVEVVGTTGTYAVRVRITDPEITLGVEDASELIEALRACVATVRLREAMREEKKR